MVEHNAYGAYTWEELLQAIWGASEGRADPKLSNPSGIVEVGERVQHVHNTLFNVHVEMSRTLYTMKESWRGPASDAFQKTMDTYLTHLDNMWHAMLEPGQWRWNIWHAGSNLEWARQSMAGAGQYGWVWIPPTTVEVPQEVISPGYDGSGAVIVPGYTETIPAHWEWHKDVVEKYMREGILIPLVNAYREYESTLGELPLPPDPGKKPSEAAAEAKQKKDLEDEKKHAKDREDKFDKEKEEADKKADAREKKLDKEKEEADKKAEQQQKDIEKAQADQKKEFDKAIDKQQADFDKAGADAQKGLDIGPPPLPGGALGGGAVPVPPPGAVGGPLDGPGGLGSPIGGGLRGVPVPGGTDLTGDGIADLDEQGKPVPGFGKPVPGGIDVSGDGNPDFDEDGNPLPGGDFSALPGAGSNGNPFLGGGFSPFGPPPFAPPEGLSGPGDAQKGVLGGNRPGVVPGSKPFVRPSLDLDGPPGALPKSARPRGLGGDLDFTPGPLPSLGDDELTPGKGRPGTSGSIPFVRPPGGGLGADAFDGGKLPQPGGTGTPVGEGGPAGRPGAAGAAAAASLRPGLGGLGAGAGGMGGYPPPMGGGMGHGGAGTNQNQERERQTWLLEDDEIWAEDTDSATGVLGRPVDNEAEDDEYTPQY